MVRINYSMSLVWINFKLIILAFILILNIIILVQRFNNYFLKNVYFAFESFM